MYELNPAPRCQDRQYFGISCSTWVLNYSCWSRPCFWYPGVSPGYLCEFPHPSSTFPPRSTAGPEFWVLAPSPWPFSMPEAFWSYGAAPGWMAHLLTKHTQPWEKPGTALLLQRPQRNFPPQCGLSPPQLMVSHAAGLPGSLKDLIVPWLALSHFPAQLFPPSTSVHAFPSYLPLHWGESRYLTQLQGYIGISCIDSLNFHLQAYPLVSRASHHFSLPFHVRRTCSFPKWDWLLYPPSGFHLLSFLQGPSCITYPLSPEYSKFPTQLGSSLNIFIPWTISPLYTHTHTHPSALDPTLAISPCSALPLQYIFIKT